MSFSKKRILYSCLLAMPLAGLSSVPLLFFGFLGYYRLLFFLILCGIYGRIAIPFVERLLVSDYRYSKCLQEGSHVAIVRLPHDFEMKEIEERDSGSSVFIAGTSGHIVSTDGVIVWVEVDFGYVVTHANCLQAMPANVIMHNFADYDEEEEFVELD